MGFKHTPEEARKLWVEALRSGKYKQGNAWLCDNGKHCCLGVACDVFHRHERSMEIRSRGYLTVFDGMDTILPIHVRAWLGLSTVGGEFDSGDESYNTLYILNDEGKSFTEIADIIESNPPGLFITQE